MDMLVLFTSLSLGFKKLIDHISSVLNGGDTLGTFFFHGNTKFLLKSHHNLNLHKLKNTRPPQSSLATRDGETSTSSPLPCCAAARAPHPYPRESPLIPHSVSDSQHLTGAVRDSSRWTSPSLHGPQVLFSIHPPQAQAV